MRLQHITHKISLLNFKSLCEYFFALNGFELKRSETTNLPTGIIDRLDIQNSIFCKLSRALFYVFVCTSLPTFKKLFEKPNDFAQLFSSMTYDKFCEFLRVNYSSEIAVDSYGYKSGYIEHLSWSYKLILRCGESAYMDVFSRLSKDLEREYIRIYLSDTDTVLGVYSQIPQLQLGLFKRVRNTDSFGMFSRDPSLFDRLCMTFKSYMSDINFYEECNNDTVVIKYIGTCMTLFISSWFKTGGLQSDQLMPVSTVTDSSGNILYISDMPTQPENLPALHEGSVSFDLIQLLTDIREIDDFFFGVRKDKNSSKSLDQQSVPAGTAFAGITDFALLFLQAEQKEKFDTFLKTSKTYSGCIQFYSNSLLGNKWPNTIFRNLFGDCPLGDLQSELPKRDITFQDRIERYQRFLSSVLNSVAHYNQDNIRNILADLIGTDVSPKSPHKDSNTTVFEHSGEIIFMENGREQYFLPNSVYKKVGLVISCYDRLLQLDSVLHTLGSSLAEFCFLYNAVDYDKNGDILQCLALSHRTVSGALDYLRSVFRRSQAIFYSNVMDKFNLTYTGRDIFYLYYTANCREQCLKCLNSAYVYQDISDGIRCDTLNLEYSTLDLYNINSNKPRCVETLIQSLYLDITNRTFILPCDFIDTFLDVYAGFLKLPRFSESENYYVLSPDDELCIANIPQVPNYIYRVVEGNNTEALLFACNHSIALLKTLTSVDVSYFKENAVSILSVIESLGELLLPVAEGYNFESILTRIKELKMLLVIPLEDNNDIKNITNFSNTIITMYNSNDNALPGGKALTNITLATEALNGSLQAFKLPYLIYHCAFYMYYLIYCSVALPLSSEQNSNFVENMGNWIFYCCLPCIGIFCAIAKSSNNCITSLATTDSIVELDKKLITLLDLVRTHRYGIKNYTLECAFLLGGHAQSYNIICDCLQAQIQPTMCETDVYIMISKLRAAFPGIQLFPTFLISEKIDSLLMTLIPNALTKAYSLIEISYLSWLKNISDNSNSISEYIHSTLYLNSVSFFSRFNFVTQSSKTSLPGIAIEPNHSIRGISTSYSPYLENLIKHTDKPPYVEYIKACLRSQAVASIPLEASVILKAWQNSCRLTNVSEFYHLKESDEYFCFSSSNYLYYLCKQDVILRIKMSEDRNTLNYNYNYKFMTISEFYEENYNADRNSI